MSRSDLGEIRDLTHRYCTAVDGFDLAGVLGVYADDAKLDLEALGMGTFEGQDALRGFYRESIDGMASQVHIAANHLLELDGEDSAHGTHYVTAIANLKDGTTINVHGLHTDTYRRTPVGWRIATRTLSMLLPPVVEAPPSV
jgi:ketosteroid isomerase-like protein